MIKYTFNENIFSIIDNEEKAYWLGFLYADGYLTDQGLFGCALQEKDKAHLNKFLTFLGMPEEEQEECIKYQKKNSFLQI